MTIHSFPGAANANLPVPYTPPAAVGLAMVSVEDFFYAADSVALAAINVIRLAPPELRQGLAAEIVRTVLENIDRSEEGNLADA